jgi:putative PEP-CTERM system TPR-repeat lipoprotein
VVDLTLTLPPLALSDSEFTHDIIVILSHLEKNQIELAEQNTLAYARIHGKTALSQYLLGLCADAKGDVDLAQLSYQAALERDPHFLPARYRLSDSYLKKSNWVSAEKSIKTTLDLSPKNMTAWLQMAQLLENQDKKTEAKAALDKAARAHPTKVEPKQAQMTFYLRQGQPEKALEMAKNLHHEYPNHYTFAHLYGQLALENKHYKVAEQVFEHLSQKAPSTPAVWQGLAESEYQLGKINQARDRADMVLSLDAHFLPAWTLKAHIAEKEKDYPMLIEVGKQLQKEAPQSIVGDMALAKGYAAQNQLDKAKEAYQQAFLKIPSAELAKSIYYLDQQLGEQAGATIPLEEWLDNHPDDAATWRFLATEHLKKGNSQKAAQCYEGLLKTTAHDLIALNNLALLKMDSEPTKALELAKKAYFMASKQPKVADTYGMALFKNNQREEALAVLQQANELFPQNKDVQEHLQWVLEN